MIYAKGFANEICLLAALLERGYNASIVDLSLSIYDILVEKSARDIVRVQFKTVSSSHTVSFVGGVRDGQDRQYKSDVKEYVQSTNTSDVVVGVESTPNNGDTEINFFFIPTIYIEKINQKSISVNKIPQAKNDWGILKKCKDHEFVMQKFINTRGSPKYGNRLF